jgi:ATP-binding cassette subfamily F protein uup
MSAQESQETKLKNTLRRETEWLRQGAKARTTKQSARIERAGELQNQVQELQERNQIRAVRIDFQDAGSAPKKLIEGIGISKSLGGRIVVPQVENILVTPKSRIGLLGANGCGKSTFLKLLLKKLSPDSGQVNHADALKVAYFEQNRESLDPKKSVLKTICPMGDHVDFGSGKVHVGGFLKRFLFGPEMHDQPVEKLSGGEQARLLIAKLMLQPANVLVLDEPTNDLDIATLNVLQEVLQDFNGAVLLVSHDRFFLDQVSKEIYAFSKDPQNNSVLNRFASIYQWQQWFEQQAATTIKSERDTKSLAHANHTVRSSGSSKPSLTFSEQHELKGMEQKILVAESKLNALVAQCSDPKVMANAKELAALSTQLAAAQLEVEKLYARWAELEGS